jgi:hypothetical protein
VRPRLEVLLKYSLCLADSLESQLLVGHDLSPDTAGCEARSSWRSSQCALQKNLRSWKSWQLKDVVPSMIS